MGPYTVLAVSYQLTNGLGIAIVLVAGDYLLQRCSAHSRWWKIGENRRITFMREKKEGILNDRANERK